jgi:hypothetical protein
VPPGGFLLARAETVAHTIDFGPDLYHNGTVPTRAGPAPFVYPPLGEETHRDQQ